jgi:transposase
VLEATYGWYWAHPLGVKAFSYRRVKNDQRDAADLADLLRMGRLPEAWIAPPATRELREWVRHRAKLVGLRSNATDQKVRSSNPSGTTRTPAPASTDGQG